MSQSQGPVVTVLDQKATVAGVLRRVVDLGTGAVGSHEVRLRGTDLAVTVDL